MTRSQADLEWLSGVSRADVCSRRRSCRRSLPGNARRQSPPSDPQALCWARIARELKRVRGDDLPPSRPSAHQPTTRLPAPRPALSRWRIGSAGASTRGYYLKQQRTGEVRRPSARLNEHGTSPRCMHRRTAWSAYRRTGAESAVHLTSARRGPDSAWILMGVRSVRKVRQAQARGPT